MSTWTQRIAEPAEPRRVRRAGGGEPAQGPGPGAWARLHAPGGDRRRQAAPDFVVRLGDASVVIDAKFALDEDAGRRRGGDRRRRPGAPGRLRPQARAHGPRTSPSATTRRSPTGAGRSSSSTCPSRAPTRRCGCCRKFSIEKFSQRHRVYVVTPSQLGLALGFVAEVAHDARRSEETEQVATTLLDAAEDMANMVDQLDQHGKHLQTAFTSYDKLVGHDRHPGQSLAPHVDRLRVRAPDAEHRRRGAPDQPAARATRARSPSAGARPRASSPREAALAMAKPLVR